MPFAAPRAVAPLAALSALALVLVGPAAVAEERVEIDFGSSAYTLGDDHPTAGEGWATWTHPTARYDWALVDTTSFAAATLPAGVALRFSNSVNNDGQFSAINQLTSPRIEAAGEPATGAVNNTFETTFTVASTTGALQPHLAVSVAFDDGAGSRSGGAVTMLHSATGLQFLVSGATPGAPAASATDWTTTYSGEFDATVPHAIRAVTTYVTDGPDVLRLYVDDVLVIETWTYEAYHLAKGSASALQTTAALLFRASPAEAASAGSFAGFATTSYPDATQKADLLGEGFLIDDLAYASYNVLPTTPPSTIPTAPPTPSTGVELAVDEDAPTADLEVVAEATGMEPGELVGFVAYSSPIFLGYAIADGAGVARLSFVPSSVGLEAGSHTIVATGVTSTRIATVALVVRALAVTGREVDESLPWLIAAAGTLVVGSGLLALGRVRPWRRRKHLRH